MTTETVQPPFRARLAGTLQGAVIGAELGFIRNAEPGQLHLAHPREMFDLSLRRPALPKATPGRLDCLPVTPFVDLGVRAYLRKGGRATCEDLAAVLADHEGIAAPAFGWDTVHSVQETLKEGMPARLNGLLRAPCGLICAAMPAVGIYHFADPEYAYLDGMELASVAQGRQGAQWAGLCAAAVAAALAPRATAESVVEAVLDIAKRDAPDLANRWQRRMGRASRLARQARDDFAAWWYHNGGQSSDEDNWPAWEPLGCVLPLMGPFGADARLLLTLLVTPPHGAWTAALAGGHSTAAAVAGAILGALGGPDAFPDEWRRWAEPQTAAWLPLHDLVSSRLAVEARIVSDTEALAAGDAGGPSRLFDKVCGCLLAGAIGNAMGSPVEGRMYWEIDEKHPGGIRTVLDPARLEGEDDNQMAMLLVETYLRREGLPVQAAHFAETWARRLNRHHFFVLCMGHAYDLIRRGADPRIIGHWSVVTGSTVMALEPVGVFHAMDGDFAAIDATAVAYMYQRGLDVTAAAMLAATVAEAMRPEATVDSVCAAAVGAAPAGPLRTFDRRPFASARDYVSACLDIADRYDDVLAARKELYDRCLLYHMIDPLELWGFALAMFKIARGDVRQAAIGGTNIGRDSDTIAGRAAMLAGTLRGAGGVPAEWIALFGDRPLERIRRNARALTDLLTGPRLRRLGLRQAVGAGGDGSPPAASPR